jgi:hypothetical protein
MLTFTPGNWTPKQATVTAVDDNVKDGNQNFKVLIGDLTSADQGYDGMNPDDVTVTTVDDDSAFVVVHKPATPAECQTSEAGTPTVTFTVELTSAPTSDVTIPLSSSLPSEGIITTPASAELVFTPSDYGPQTVTVTGVQDDGTVDGDIMYVIELGLAQSSDTNYDGLDPDDVDLLNLDDDVP